MRIPSTTASSTLPRIREIVELKRLPDFAFGTPVRRVNGREVQEDRSIDQVAALDEIIDAVEDDRSLRVNVRDLVVGEERSSRMPAAGRQPAKAIGKPTGQSSEDCQTPIANC